MMRLTKSGQVAVLVGSALLVYGNSLQGGFHYDDFHSILWNPHIRELGNLPAFFCDPQTFSADPEKGMYRPVLLVTYALNYALGGYEVFGYHLVNLLLHILNAGLVWWLAGLLLARWEVALLAGVLFALHPLASEPVNYLSSRSESLAGLFYLLGLGLFVRSQQGGGKRLIFLSWGALLLGLLSKETAITLPAVLLIFDWLFVSRRNLRRLGEGFARRHLPYWGIAAGYLALIWGNGFLRHSVGVEVRDGWTQALTQLKAVAYYLYLLCWPLRLNVEHQFFEQEAWGDAVLWGALLVVLSGVFLLVCLYRRRWDLPLFLGVWGVLALLPVLVMPLNVLVNERRLYLTGAAFCIGLALLLRGVWSRRGLVAGQNPGIWVGALLLLVYGVLTHHRNPVWRDELSLWTDAAAKSPGMPRVHVHRGNAQRELGQFDRAREAYAAALHIDPQHRAARTNLANLYYEAGRKDPRQGGGFLEEAAREYEQVLAIDPDYREALNNLGSVYLVLGELDKAREAFGRVAAQYPNFAEGRFNLGLVASRQGDYPQAIGHFRQAIALQEDAEYYFELGNAQVAAGALEEGEEAYRRAVRLTSGEVRYAYNLAEVLLVLGERQVQAGEGAGGMARWREARELLRQVIRQAPQYGRAGERLRQLEERLR